MDFWKVRDFHLRKYTLMKCGKSCENDPRSPQYSYNPQIASHMSRYE